MKAARIGELGTCRSSSENVSDPARVGHGVFGFVVLDSVDMVDS